MLLLATLQVDVSGCCGVLQLLPIPPFKGDFIGKAFIDVLPSRDRRPSTADISRRSTMRGRYYTGYIEVHTKVNKKNFAN